MALLTWSESLAVNVSEFDGHHKKLIALINELYDAMSVGKGKDVLGKVLNSLLDYTRMHFAAEEKAMQGTKYPAYLTHKAEHDKLTQQVADLAKKFQEGKGVITVEVMSFLKEWLTKHIQGTDKKYSPHFNSNGVK